ncbi:GreA/GreB family elongation factor [Nafulsella turpanensis]|uniref:GreA/GreB family elongation factor n=1 Tax=Nafulsella turpanensis TaxID=1265690 RepID=UPI00034CC4C4|nr:GreA/GreB family elongation factor [Nafulsella turpanensis]
MKSEIKIKLHAQCLQWVAGRIEEATRTMEETQAAANEETKSSAGDKYETSREMMRQEQDKVAWQLMENLKLKKVLDSLKPEITHEKGQLGSLLRTSEGNFYLSASLGQLKVDGEVYMMISPVSPLAQKLLGKRKGEEVQLNGRHFYIEEVL